MTSNREVKYRGEYYEFVEEDGWEYIHPAQFDDVVVIVAITDSNKLVLVEQYRVPAGKQVIELPAGLVGDEAAYDGEGIIETARRELIEETGYDARNIEIVACGPPSAGSNTLSVNMLLATGLEKVGPGGGVEGESILVHELDLDDIETGLESFIANGLVVDLKIYAGLWFARMAIKQIQAV